MPLQSESCAEPWRRGIEATVEAASRLRRGCRRGCASRHRALFEADSTRGKRKGVEGASRLYVEAYAGHTSRLYRYVEAIRRGYCGYTSRLSPYCIRRGYRSRQSREAHGYLDTLGYLKKASIADTGYIGYIGIAHTQYCAYLHRSSIADTGYCIADTGYTRTLEQYTSTRTAVHSTPQPHLI